jgi:hypothetical protein
MGIESPSAGRQSDLVNKWRCSRHRFFAANFPFFFFSLRHLGASLAGDETNGTKSTHLPKLRQPANLERWHSKRASRKSPAVRLQRLRQTFYTTALAQPLPFFSTEASD